MDRTQVAPENAVLRFLTESRVRLLATLLAERGLPLSGRGEVQQELDRSEHLLRELGTESGGSRRGATGRPRQASA